MASNLNPSKSISYIQNRIFENKNLKTSVDERFNI